MARSSSSSNNNASTSATGTNATYAGATNAGPTNVNAPIIPTILQSFHVLELAKQLCPITDFQGHYSTFTGFEPSNYHDQVKHSNMATSEKTFTWVMLLCVCTSAVNRKVMAYKYVGTGPNKKPKVDVTDHKYRHLYTFANIMSGGSTLVLFKYNKSNILRNLHYFDKYHIGNQFAIIKPDTNVSNVASQMPVIETTKQLILAVLPKWISAAQDPGPGRKWPQHL